MNLLNTLAKHLHILILAYTGYITYEQYEKKNETINSIRQSRPGFELQKKKIQDTLTLADNFKKDLDVIKNKVDEIKDQIDKVQKQLPSQTNDTEILESFRTEADKINIKDKSFSPEGTEVEQGPYFYKEYKFKGKGTWLQLLIFFENIMNKQRIYNVSSVEFKKSGERLKGRFQMVELESIIRAFRFNPDYSKMVKKETDGESDKNKKGKKGKGKKKK